MTIAHTIAVCLTILACYVVRAVMSERHARFWADRDIDGMRKGIAAAQTTASTAKDLSVTVESRMTQFERDNAFRR